MKLLLVKLSSLGDVVHAFPALTDAARARPDLEVHWLVEEAFEPVARLHPAVAAVIPVALRRWRRRPFAHLGDLADLRRRLREERYERVVDAQGLVKSAVVARFARAPVDGFDAASAREGIATIAYARQVAVSKALHAVDRLRRLLAAALGYPVPDGPADFGVVRAGNPGTGPFLFLHGTTWDNKRWPETFWRALAATVTAHGHDAVLPWGGDDERARAARIASDAGRVRVAPQLPLCDIVGAIAGARAVVTVDSGLGQLAAALGVPTVALFGPTDPALTGCRGARAVNLAAAFPCAPCRRRRCGYRGAAVVRDGAVVEPPCFSSLPPERVWAALESVL